MNEKTLTAHQKLFSVNGLADKKCETALCKLKKTQLYCLLVWMGGCQCIFVMVFYTVVDVNKNEGITSFTILMSGSSICCKCI